MIFHRLCICNVLLITAQAAPALCAPPSHHVYVSAPEDIEEETAVGSKRSVISRNMIEKQQSPLVSDLLKSLPGVTVTPTTTPGSTTHVTLRGAKNKHTLVLINGIPMNDASAGGAYDFSQLSSSDIEKIEVLPGSDSVLYGSNAVGGVIKITTRHGQKKPQARGLIEGGSYQTARTQADISGASTPWRYYLSGTAYRTGRGDLKNQAGIKQSDRAHTAAAQTRITYSPTPHLDLEGFLSSTTGETKINDDLTKEADHYSGMKNILGSVSATLSTLEDTWEHRLTLSQNQTQQKHTQQDMRHANATRQIVRYQGTVVLNETNATLYGLERSTDQVKSTSTNGHHLELNSGFVRHQIRVLDRLSLSAGGRYDHSPTFTSKGTYRFGAALDLTPRTTLHTTYGTGVRMPVPSELFGFGASARANRSLKPESSYSFDLGIAHHFTSIPATIDATYFHLLIQDLMCFKFENGAFVTVNQGSRRTQGMELHATLSPTEALTLEGNYTYTLARDSATNQMPTRLPKHKVDLKGTYHVAEKLDIFGEGSFVGARTDDDFNVLPLQKRRLKGYFLATVGVNYAATRHITLFGRLENALNQRYETVFGYATRGLSAFIGVAFKTPESPS